MYKAYKELCPIVLFYNRESLSFLLWSNEMSIVKGRVQFKARISFPIAMLLSTRKMFSFAQYLPSSHKKTLLKSNLKQSNGTDLKRNLDATTFTCLVKLLLGLTMDRIFLTLNKAVSRFHSYSFIRNEMTTEADRLIPILQWTKTLPELFLASLMNVYVELKYLSWEETFKKDN